VGGEGAKGRRSKSSLLRLASKVCTDYQNGEPVPRREEPLRGMTNLKM
jgi:hypothetical protein